MSNLLAYKRRGHAKFVGTSVPTPPSGDVQTVAYTADTTTDFLNPSRGWHAAKSYSGDFNGVRVASTPATLTRALVRIDEFRNSAISTSWLNSHGELFSAARSAGIKLQLRYAYNYTETGQDASESRIIQHIGQLAPVWQSNADVIDALQAGFVGAWGEWNRGTNGLVDNLDPTARNNIISALLSNMPESVPVLLRYPELMEQYLGSRLVLGSNDYFSGSAAARLGILNDCFLANVTDSGTYIESRWPPDFSYGAGTDADAKKTWWANVSAYSATSGETCDSSWTEGNRIAGALSVAEMEQFHWDVLNYEYSATVVQGWRNSGHFNEISRRLGYRFVLLNATLPNSVAKGQPFSVKLNLRNDGFGKMYKQQPIDIVFIGPSTRTIRLTADARKDLPLGGETRELNYTATIPSDMASGSYAMHLSMPDAAPSLASDIRYSVRLANVGLWANGRNSLNANVAVAEESTQPVTRYIAGVGSASTSRVNFPKTGAVTTGNWYVATNGSDSAAGSFSAPFRTITKALSVAQNGQTILVRAGTYPAFYLSKKWTSDVKLFGYGTERPLLNGGGSNITAFMEDSAHLHIKGFEIINGADYGLRLSRCDDMKLEDIWIHHSATNEYGTGFIIYECNRILIQDCATWWLGTPGVGGSTNAPDGIVVTAEPNTGRVTTYCDIVRSMNANCVDDGIDFYRARNSRIIDCVALASGYFYDGANQGTDGNGFKLGGETPGYNELAGSITVHAFNNGVNYNGAPNTVTRYNTSVLSRIGFAFRFTEATAEAYNNISLNNSEGDTQQATPNVQSNNSWQLGLTYNGVKFASPSSGDFSLLPGSTAIGSGTGGTNLGASEEALNLLMRWWNHNQIWVPNRGLGTDAAPLPDIE